MGIKVRYRISVKTLIEVEQRFTYLFRNKTKVDPGNYDITMDSMHYDKERDIQELRRRFSGIVDAKIMRRFMEDD